MLDLRTDGRTDPEVRVETPSFHDAGHGFDVFGLHPPVVEQARRWAWPWYAHYFRVRSYGIANVPTVGPGILIANHGGMLPLDAAMLWVDVLHRTGRVLRTIADRFVPRLPFVSSFLARTGVVSGTHANVRHLLDRGELIAIFPEGVAGPAKSYRARYELQDWRVGHAELAIRHGVPVIPIGIVGPEESWPLLARLPVRLFGAPYVPIPITPVPLPVRFEIHYGKPLEFPWPPSAADDPEIVASAARATRDAVNDLLACARAERGRS